MANKVDSSSMLDDIGVSEIPKLEYKTAYSPLKMRYVFGIGRLKIEYRGLTIELTQSNKLLSNIDKDKDMKPFRVLMEFCEYKGEEFSDKLFEIYMHHSHYISTRPHITLLEVPNFLTHDILDLFKLSEMVAFVEDSNIPVPGTLKEEFTEGLTKDEIKTFTKSQYLDLVALVAINSAVSPILALQVAFTQSFSGNQSVIQGFDIVIEHDIWRTPIGDKFLKYVEVIYNESAKELLMISKNTSEEDYKLFIAATLLYGKFTVHDVYDAPPEKNLASKFYVTTKGKTNATVRQRTTITASDEKRSAYDVILTPYDLTGQCIAEVKFITSDPLLFVNQYGERTEEEMKLFTVALDACKGTIPSEASVAIMTWVIKDFLNPQATGIIGTYTPDKQGMHKEINICRATAFMLIYPTFPHIARLIISNNIPLSDNIVLTAGNMKLKPKSADIDELFPWSITGKQNVVEMAIHAVADMIFKQNLVCNLPLEYLEYGHTMPIDHNLKVNLFELLKYLRDANIKETIDVRGQPPANKENLVIPTI